MFELLEYTFFQNALLCTILIGVSCGLIGTYIVAKRMVFISGGITHASFGGLGLAYFLGLSPLLGAAVFALAAAFCILYLSDNKRFKEDSLIGIFWSAGMAIGVLFIYLTPGYAPNLLSYLFGNILTVTGEQVILSLLLCLVIIVFFAKFYRPLFYIAFDKEYSRTHFIALNGLEIGVTALIALCIVLCMKLAGIILVISYLTMPQAIAGMFHKNFTKQLVWATIISCVGSIIGLFASAALKLPSGATIVLCFLLIFLVCYLWKRNR
ncbi:metal ABC transporter permease [Butyricimonas faecalis]|uniref:Metal ABC transporter permease n=1 Tax=Butyricimonas faecalis TaxID=2093856 RepID=A0A3Q9IS02_9BACT|nr:metal ABC transporter permease [Butyricimonas faecalis]AZS31459.1 metal ABC transporter permease [Butyricimonas faecalis]